MEYSIQKWEHWANSLLDLIIVPIFEYLKSNKTNRNIYVNYLKNLSAIKLFNNKKNEQNREHNNETIKDIIKILDDYNVDRIAIINNIIKDFYIDRFFFKTNKFIGSNEILFINNKYAELINVKIKGIDDKKKLDKDIKKLNKNLENLKNNKKKLEEVIKNLENVEEEKKQLEKVEEVKKQLENIEKKISDEENKLEKNKNDSEEIEKGFKELFREKKSQDLRLQIDNLDSIYEIDLDIDVMYRKEKDKKINVVDRMVANQGCLSKSIAFDNSLRSLVDIPPYYFTNLVDKIHKTSSENIQKENIKPLKGGGRNKTLKNIIKKKKNRSIRNLIKYYSV